MKKRDPIEESLAVQNGLQVHLNRARANGLPTKIIERAIRTQQYHMDAETRAFLADGGPEFLTKTPPPPKVHGE